MQGSPVGTIRALPSPEAGSWSGRHPWSRRGDGVASLRSLSPRCERPSAGPARACSGRHASAPSGGCGRPQPRAKAGAHRAPGRPSLNRPERRRAGPPPPTGTPIRARAPCEGTTGPRRRPPRNRAARHRRPRGRHDRPQPAAGAPSSPARRPDRLAFYMGCCADRGEGRVTRGQVRPARQTAVRRAPAGALLRSSKAQARRLACSESGRLLPFVQLSSARACQAVRHDCSFAERGVSPVLLVVVHWGVLLGASTGTLLGPGSCQPPAAAAWGATAAAAVRITSATTSGWETMITCEPSASVIVAPARSAIERTRSVPAA
jgi:hypothetical protein